jgi:hypothetical protein
VIEHLWAVIGKSPMPVAIAIECLRPQRVTPIVTEEAAVEQLLRTYPGIVWSNPVVIDGFDPVMAATELRSADLQPGDLLWGPGTTPMNIEVVNRWTLDQATKWGDNDCRRWYLPARGGVLLPDIGAGVNVADALVRAQNDGADVLCTLEGLCGLSRLPAGSVPRWSRQVDANFGSPFQAAQLTPLVLRVLRLHRIPPAEITNAVGNGGRRGDLLEAVAFHLVANILRSLAASGSVVAPTTVSLGVKAAPPGQDTVTELDVVIQSGPLLTNISCGAVKQTSFKTKFMEAKERAQQVGGSEARALLFCHRTTLTSAKQVPTRPAALQEARADRVKLDVGEAYGSSGSRFGICRLDEIFAARQKKQVEAVLADPVSASESNQIPGLQQFVDFVRNSVYR